MKCRNLGSKDSDKSNYNDDHAEYGIKETNGEESKDDDNVDSKAGSNNEGKEEVCVKKEIDAKQSGNDYYSKIPTYLHKYVKNLFDPLGNGNCGFWCIAKALGYNDDGWLQVRNKMVEEVAGNIEAYTRMQGGKQSVKTIINKIKAKSLKTKIMKGKWLDKLLHGHILANAYVRPIIFISLITCTTFLPLRLGPQDSKNPEPIYLLHVNKNHWVLANLEGDEYGIKPIPPTFLVPKLISRSAQGWPPYLKKGLELFNQERHD
jgi:hypothetical protein